MASSRFLFILSILICTNITNSICHNNNIINTPRKPKPKKNFKSLFTFGDAFLDSGNNNFILTLIKANHPPYGQDYPGRVATGRFSDGKLISDFIASEIGIKDTLPPFLEPNLSNHELSTGVSFASAGSGFDDLTTALTNAIPVTKQIELFKTYLEKIRVSLGDVMAKNIVDNSLVFIAAGSDDFQVNYYGAPTRHFHLGLSGYQDFLHLKIQDAVKTLYGLGCRNFMIAGLPPIGCKPLEITTKLRFDRKCVDDENKDAESYNQKLIPFLNNLNSTLPGAKLVYADIYTPIIDMVTNPKKYGFTVTNSGCCGSGFIEAGLLCKGLSPACPNPAQFLFWDSANPTESANRYIAEFLKNAAISRFL